MKQCKNIIFFIYSANGPIRRMCSL